MHKYPTTYTQIQSQRRTNTQPLLLRLSCIPCTNILRPHYKMKGTDNTLITTNIYQYTPISEKRSHNTFLKKMFGMLSLLAISSPFNTDSRIALVYNVYALFSDVVITALLCKVIGMVQHHQNHSVVVRIAPIMQGDRGLATISTFHLQWCCANHIYSCVPMFHVVLLICAHVFQQCSAAHMCMLCYSHICFMWSNSVVLFGMFEVCQSYALTSCIMSR